MNEYNNMIARQRKWMFYLLAIMVLGWGFTPYQTVFLGLLLGTTLSFFNLWVMQRKINRFGQAISKGDKVYGIGTFTRLASAAVAVVIAMRYDVYFHMIGVMFGLMTTYVVIMIDFFIFEVKTGKGK